VSDRTFYDYVASLGEFGDRLAVTSRPSLKIERLTFHELRARAYQTAHYLAAQGVQPGDRVMVVALNSPQWLELLLGTLAMGAVLVPVDAASTPEVVRGFAAQTNPTLVFAGRGIDLDGAGPLEIRSLDDLAELLGGFSSEAPATKVTSDQPALIVFTSGTTADPKGVMLTHGNILANIEGITRRIDVEPYWRLLSVLPLSHMYELSGTLAVMSRGASVVYLPRVTPLTISQALVDYHITAILAIPELLTLMLERINQSARDEGKTRVLALASKLADHLPFSMRRALFHSVHVRLGGRLDLVVTGGAPIPIDVATAWERMGVRMVEGYGLTETSPILTGNALDERRFDSPGRALDNVELRIADDGEIQARGPSVFSEYWQNPVATRAAFTDDGWFRTGDVGRLENGWLHVQGRLKFAIVRASGLKVFPEDIELVTDRDDRLGAVCVVGVDAGQGEGEQVVAVIASSRSDGDVERAIADVNAQVASFQHVDGWRRWPDADFPRTRLLKIDRRQVQLWANSASAVRTEPVAAPDTGDEVARIIRLSLDDPSATVRATDRLGDIGLDSLRRLTVVSLLEERLGVSIADDAVTSLTTVAELRVLSAEGSPVEEFTRRPTWTYWPWVRLVGDWFRDVVLYGVVRWWVTLDVKGLESLDGLETPALFIFNHSDDFDGPVIYQALPIRIRRRLAVATGQDVLRDHKVLAFIVRFCFAGFDFARSDPYLPSLRYVGEMIDRGWNVVIAPEGSISTTGELRPFKVGVGLLAVTLGVPVVPMKTFGLTGTVPLHAKWPRRRSRVVVRIGTPLRFGSHTDYEEATAALHRAMESLTAEGDDAPTG
jgi:long-chain acyl-CoA synthetase